MTAASLFDHHASATLAPPARGAAPAPTWTAMPDGERVGRQVRDGMDVIVYPGGAFFPANDLRPTCGTCNRTKLALVRRWVEIGAVAPGEAGETAILCPACLPLNDHGRNVHGRRERRVILGWMDCGTGIITLVAKQGESR